MVAVFVVVLLAAGLYPAPYTITAAPAPVKLDMYSVIKQILKQQKQLVVDSERHERLLKDVEFSLRHFKGVEAKMSILEEELLDMREELSSRPGDQQQGGETGHLQPATDEPDREAACEDEPGYESLGCWRDTSASRAIPSLEGIDPRLDGHYSTRQDAFQKCYTVARSMGLKVFALQNGGWCGGSADGNVDFRKHGPSEQCYIGGEGGPWSNHVYEIKDIACNN
ncbi:uncharacterized protein LOC144862160 [Branchiostoma floridae x Branchiostoma japonicum]